MKVNRLFLFFSILVFFIATIKIVFFLNFWILPAAFFAVGFFSAFWSQKYSLYLFVFLFPFINSTPCIFDNGYPYNYMAPALFLLSGIIIAFFIKKIKNFTEFTTQEKRLDKNFYPYYIFLLFLVISTIFVILRWSNITFSSIAAVGADTPVSPTLQRISFASIFPVVSLFICFISPYIFFYIKKINIKEKLIFTLLSFGFFVSIAIAIAQKIFNQPCISDRLGKALKQFNGGSSDFNALGYFSGIMFLWATYEIKKKNILGYITFFISLTGGILSGSRTFFFFIIAGILNLVLNKDKERKKQQKIVTIILILLVIGMIFFAGGTLKDRIGKGFYKNGSLFETLNEISNGRVWMSMFSFETIRDNFISGVGTGNFTFYLTYKNFKKKYVYDLTLNHYLLIFTENGVFAFIFFMAFLVLLFRRSNKKLLIGTILFTLLFSNFFWLPEVFLLFWILVAINDSDKKELIKRKIPDKSKKILITFAISIYIILNILKFSFLHPKTWAQETRTRYDYGFWYMERDKEGDKFQWTKNLAGIYIKLNKKGESLDIKLVCGAPLAHLKSKKQKVEIYWKGKIYREVTFTENRNIFLKIKSKPLEEGFLEIKVLPDFNLKKMELSSESRDLGIQFYINEND